MIKKVFGWLSSGKEKKSEPGKIGGIFGRLTPEAMCGLDSLDNMDSTAVKAHLAKLYKRHNDAAGSLDPELRAEAEQMLDAIAHCREKYVDAVSRKKAKK